MADEATKFTLRFHNSQTHELLGVVAEQWGVSKNRLAEEMLERELNAAALLVAKDLDDTIRRLHDYRVEERLEDDIQAFAEGEAYADDPLRARMASVSTEQTDRSDPYGVLGAFGA
ncbi:MAG TPA: hypothetical protein VF255_08000 [Solirubrobacterales bacterium]